MLLLDVNVVLAAYRADHPDHDRVRSWFEAAISGGDGFSVPVGVWASFLRLVTNRRVFPTPTPLDEAFAFIEAVHAHPRHLALGPGPRHLLLLRQVCEEYEATGDLVPDAALAAVAVEHGCVVASLDRDLTRFRSVPHVNPLDA
jgi:toxin-antitoxin system PIN domain toxin